MERTSEMILGILGGIFGILIAIVTGIILLVAGAFSGYRVGNRSWSISRSYWSSWTCWWA